MQCHAWEFQHFYLSAVTPTALSAILFSNPRPYLGRGGQRPGDPGVHRRHVAFFEILKPVNGTQSVLAAFL